MKLPDIDYTAPVQSSDESFARVGEAGRRTAQVISEGLTKWGQAVIKTEAEEAQAHLATGLAEVERDLTSRRYVSKQELQQTFGQDLTGLDPVLRGRIGDREEIPTYEVAGAIYDKRAKELLGQAAAKVSVRGWRSEFEAAAAGDILAQKQRLASLQAHAMNADLRARKETLVETLTRAGAYSAAFGVAQSSEVHSPEERARLEEYVEKGRQEAPLEQRALAGVESTDDVLEAGKLIQRLESGDGFDRLDPKERTDWKRRLEAEVKHFEAIQKGASGAAEDAQDEIARNAVLDAYLARNGRPLPMKIVPKPGAASARVREWAIRLVESTAPGKKEQEFDAAAYAKLNELASPQNAVAFKSLDLMGLPEFQRLRPEDQRKFFDLQRTLKEKGPDDPKYTSFYGPQEETQRQLTAKGFTVHGKADDVEKDALAVGWVQHEVDRALARATQQKAKAKAGTTLNVEEQDAIITKVVEREVAAKSWLANKNAGIDPTFLPAVRDSAIRRGKGVTPEALKGTWTEFQAWSGDIETGWRELAGDRVLTPGQALKVFDLVGTQGPLIRAALEKKGKDASSTSVAREAVRYYLRSAQ